MKKIEKVTLAGLGAIGCFFAPGLYGTLGENFRVLAGGERKKRLEDRGVVINEKTYHFPIVEPETEGDPADLVIISVKDTGLAAAIADLKNQVGADTLILSVLNGVESEEKVAEVYGWEHVLYSLMRVSSVMRDGVCSYDPANGAVFFGEKENRVLSDRVLAVKELFDASRIRYVIEEDMIHAIWYKFMANVGENMTCAVLGIPFGEYRTNAHANWLREAAMREVQAIAREKGILLTEEEFIRQGKIILGIRPENKPSTLQDLEQGRKTEIEMFSGKVVRLGQELGIPTPVNEVYYHAVKALEEKGIKQE
ncbi:MAG: 2-dehydropantoate 2-reductase [Candidatus Limivivens sp.]|nr:2-dehydropantoate 2-reductase [Candidatus Limivivens sp.]